MGESTHPRPAQRKSPLRLFTVSGWMEGTVHVPEEEPLLEFLNGEQNFLPLTDVALASGATLPFLALAKSAVILIQPSDDELIEASSRTSQRTKITQVSCLFPGGMVMGMLAIPGEFRVSDELMESGSFFLVGNCTVGIDSSGSPEMAASPHMLLHAAKIIGVAEMKS